MNKTDTNSIRGTKTERNLLKAFAGESQALTRYTFFAEVAHSEGYEKVAEIFESVARNEKAHALVFFGFLEGGMLDISASYQAGVVGSTAENLAAAAAGEYDEWSDLYPEYAQVAKDEGFTKIALAFEYIVGIERSHERKFLTLRQLVEDKTMFKRDKAIRWVCSECGYEHTGEKAPKSCPVCGKEVGFFEPKGSICDGVECEFCVDESCDCDTPKQ